MSGRRHCGCDWPCLTTSTPSDLDEVISRKHANLSSRAMGSSFWRLLHQASSAASAIVNLSERRVGVVKSGSLRCANKFK